MNVLHLVGGNFDNGAFSGAKILHDQLLDMKVNSNLINNSLKKNQIDKKKFKKVYKVQNTNVKKIKYYFFVIVEKLLKKIFLPSPRQTFTFGFMGFDITKLYNYKNCDIIHIHWLGEGFINLNSLKKVSKPIVWTMRDMWAFSGGSHYTMDFQTYEKKFISKYIQRRKLKYYETKIQFVAVSNWLKKFAKKSYALRNKDIIKIDNNVDTKKLLNFKKDSAKKFLNIKTDKQIILYGAQNPQSKRKGWHLFIKSLKKLKKENYLILIFGNFWSQSSLDNIGIEYKSFGFISDFKKLSAIYSSADIFVASSIQDAWPKTFAESMYCKTPVVCFANTSISEIVDHKINGYIVNKFNSNELFKGIQWLLDRVRSNNDLGKNAKQKILNYQPKIITKKYLELYKKLLSAS
jgi:glycosyltransferase involved in cell wall biosynthesis